MLNKYESFGRYPKAHPKRVINLNWMNEFPNFNSIEESVLPFGLGNSYGDSCLNENGVILDARGLNRFIHFDKENGFLRVEAGVTLAEILRIIVPAGWFLSVTPGTTFVTVGGAIANDVHGKNHHVDGTFGKFVRQFEILRSDGKTYICSMEQNSDLYKATIGGLGLTGIILWAEIALKPIVTSSITMESIKYNSVEDFFELSKDSEKNMYVVSWIDSSATGKNLGRGLFMRGDHSDKPGELKAGSGPLITFPFDAPFINGPTVKMFNKLYYAKQLKKYIKADVHYTPFFHPLDAVREWNKAYGQKGFLQYQFLLPFGKDNDLVKKILQRIGESGLSSFLVVMKTCGDVESPGMLSFPRPGVTVALDFRMTPNTMPLLDELDKHVVSVGGKLYPAKDARMSGENFKRFYPKWQEFSKFIDPKFSSSFWRRVMK